MFIMEQEIRSFNIELRANPESRLVEGVAIPFNVKSPNREGFREMIVPEAVDGVIEVSDILMLYNHDKDNAQQYEAKYKGDYKIQIPDANNERRQHPEWDLKKLNESFWCIEKSNPGYKFDGDTDHIGELKGKVVGINVREAVYNGNTFTQIGQLEVADDVRKGIVKTMKPRSDGSGLPATTPEDPSGFTPVETDELPF